MPSNPASPSHHPLRISHAKALSGLAPSPADRRYAAIRFPNYVSEDEAQRLLGQVKEVKDVGSTASFFLPAY